jgi:preprotein translocase subunit SecG
VNILLLVLHVVLSLGIITLVLLQKGAGASAGAAFGGGGGGSVFGASGSANFLSKTTALFAIGFFANSLVLAYLAANREVQTDSVLDALIAPAAEVATELSSDAPSDIPAPEALENLAPAPDEVDSSSVVDVPPADVPSPEGE